MDKPLLMNILLIETALELIPPEFYKINSVKNMINKHGNIIKILDTTYHHTFMNKMIEKEKRGRPDILHHYLLDTLNSPANLHGNLRIFFSTTQTNELYTVNSEMKCPRSYNRFKGLMVKLLRTGHIPNGEPYLINKCKEELSTWLKDKNIFMFTSQGQTLKLEGVSNLINDNLCSPPDPNKELLIIIGGFQSGHFSQEFSEFEKKSIKIGTIGYDSAVITQRILMIYEQIFNLL